MRCGYEVRCAALVQAAQKGLAGAMKGMDHRLGPCR